tara:strand:- start:938 stop:1420 length:483 start_codon:yes stop_codon:yes gene_type:complete
MNWVMANQSPIIKQVITLGLLLAFVGSAWLIVDTGVGQTYDVITNDTKDLTQDTLTTFGGSVGFADRIVMIGAWITVLTGIGAVSASSMGSNRAFAAILKSYPLVLGLVGFIEFSDVINDMVSGEYDFDASSDGQNALNVFITGSFITGLAAVFGMQRKL